MKSRGIIRKIDHLGRLVIPKEIRDVQHINNGEEVEILVEDDTISIKKYSSLTNFEKIIEAIYKTASRYCSIIITNTYEVIRGNNILNNSDLLEKKFYKIINERKTFIIEKEKLQITDNFIIEKGIIKPIIINGDLYGSIVLILNRDNNYKKEIEMLNILVKIVENYIQL